jgi:UDP:flavonoid glycosyltransferase YjiC (YdhE family)
MRMLYGVCGDGFGHSSRAMVVGRYLEELKACKAIIATAGFTLMSEALYLKKPYLALPLKGQFC